MYLHKKSGLWAAYLNGRTVYLDGDKQRAKEALAALTLGQRPATWSVDWDYLVNHWLAAQEKRIGRITKRSFDDYQRFGKRLLKIVGRKSAVDHTNLHEISFDGAPVTRKNDIIYLRALLNHGVHHGLITNRPFNLEGPKMIEVRRYRAQKGIKLFDAATCRQLIEHGGTWILFGLNGALGSEDLVHLPAIEDGWLNYPRPKTGIERRIPLWPETIAAPFHRPRNAGEVTRWFYRLCKDCNCYQRGRGFYTLRHVFFHVASECDEFAARAIMGHAPRSISDTYRNGVSDQRLQKTVNFVRQWAGLGLRVQTA